MDTTTYEPISDHLPGEFTVEDLRSLYVKLQPLFTDDDRPTKVIQIDNN